MVMSLLPLLVSFRHYESLEILFILNVHQKQHCFSATKKNLSVGAAEQEMLVSPL